MELHPTPSMTVIIRKAAPSDAEGIARAHVESWQTTYKGIVSADFLAAMSAGSRVTKWQDTLASLGDRRFVFVAEEAGRIIGFVNGMDERENDPRYTGEVGGLYLLEEAQRQGTGRKLMRTAARELAKRGHTSMLLWVLKDNLPARKFYEALGGKILREKPISIGDQTLPEISYGWDNLINLIKE